MRKAYLSLLSLGVFYVCMGQAKENYIEFYGKVLNQKDSSAVSASIFYEKLPYYDDMGMEKSGSDGQYKFYLINNTKYNFKITKEGYVPFSSQITTTDKSGNGAFEYLFYIEPESEPELITLENLIFSRGSDKISESSHKGLDELVSWLNEKPKMVIQLEGHTDFAGNAEANMRLSQARVEAVKEYLVNEGIKKDRVFTKAFGGTQPLSTDRSDVAKTKNRRVEVRVISK